jgi:hypothetical protein
VTLTGARNTAATRRDERAEREAEDHRRVFLGTNGADVVKFFGPIAAVVWDQPDAFEPIKDFTADDVIADLVRRIGLAAADPAASGIDAVGLTGKDLVLWRAEKALAVIRIGADGKPEVLRLTKASGTTGGAS